MKRRQTTDLKQQQAKIYHFNINTTMIIIFEFSTLQGHKYPCNFSGRNMIEAKKELKKMYPDLQIEFICFRIIEEWECLTGLA